MDELTYPLDWEFPYLGENGEVELETERPEEKRIVRTDRFSEAMRA